MADEDVRPPRPGSPPEFHIAWRAAGMTDQGEDGNPTRRLGLSLGGPESVTR